MYVAAMEWKSWLDGCSGTVAEVGREKTFYSAKEGQKMVALKTRERLRCMLYYSGPIPSNTWDI